MPTAAPVRSRLAACLLLPLLLLLAACSQPPEPVTLNGTTMGTGWTVRLGAIPPDVSVPALRLEIEALLERVNAQMSTYREDADISRFNRAAAGEVLTVPEDFARVLAAALALAEATDGAYDPTVGPLVNLWGFGPDPSLDRIPAEEQLAQARRRVGWQRIGFEPGSGQLTQTGELMLDFSSIAKGYAVDLIAEHLLAHGIDNHLVDIGGDLRTRGVRPDGRPWRIGIERPLAGSRQVHSVLSPGNLAMATSGSYRNFFRDQGREFSHTIDPRTGYPVQHALVSVTVLHASCMQADALATAISVLGPDEGLAFAREHGLAVLMLVAGNDAEGDAAVNEIMTPEFARHLDPGAH
jgi:FAD:protein FMN transferase